MFYIPLPFFTENEVSQLLSITLFFREKKEIHIKITDNNLKINQTKNGENKILLNKDFKLENEYQYFFYYNYDFKQKRMDLKFIKKNFFKEDEIANLSINNEKLQQIETNFTKKGDYSQLLSTDFYENFILKKLNNLNSITNYIEIRDTIVYFNLKTFFNKCYHSNYGKNFNYLLKDNEKEEIQNQNFNLPKKFATFVMCVKNRAERAKISILSALEQAEYFDFIIVEDQSNNLINLEEIDHKNKDKLEYHLLDLNVPWSRSALLNFGIKKAKTPYVLMWDVDFLFPKFFGKELYSLMNKIDYNKFLIQISLFETEFNYKTSQFYKICDPYSSVWIYPTHQLKEILGFNEKFIGHGFEERELQMRLFNQFKTNLLKSHQVNEKCYAFHLSHTDGTRFEDDFYYKLRNHNFLVMKDCEKNKNTKAEHQKDKWGKGIFPEIYFKEVVKPRYLENLTIEK